MFDYLKPNIVFKSVNIKAGDTNQFDVKCITRSASFRSKTIKVFVQEAPRADQKVFYVADGCLNTVKFLRPTVKEFP